MDLTAIKVKNYSTSNSVSRRVNSTRPPCLEMSPQEVSSVTQKRCSRRVTNTKQTETLCKRLLGEGEEETPMIFNPGF